MASPPRPPRPPRPTTGDRASLPSLSGEEAPPDFAAVEAAIARLEGRDPTLAADVALARRDGERRRDELKAVVDDASRRVAAQEEKKRRLVPIAAGALIVLLGLGAGLYVNYAAHVDAAEALRAAAVTAAAPFRAAGFIDRSFHTEATVTVRSEPGTCYLAVGASTTGPAEVRLDRGVENAQGVGSAAWCGCSNAEVVVTARATGPAAVMVLLAPAETFGGADHLGALSPAPAAHLPETEDRACAEKAVDQLVAETPLATPAEPDEVAQRLVSGGFRHVGSSPASARFVRLPDTGGTCFVVRSEGASDGMTLRLPGGARPLVGKTGALAFCQETNASASVWREGKGALTIFAAPVVKVGGALGLGESLRRAGLPDVPIHRSPERLEIDAKAALLASGATPAHLVQGTTSLLGSPEPPFLLAFSTGDTSTSSAIAQDGSVVCDPPLASAPMSALCLGPLEPFEGAKVQRANRPEWLRLEPNPAAYGEVLQLLALSRRLSLLGFQPSSIAGVTTTPVGADVVGRAGESAVVAVALASKPPFVRPLTDGAAWTITTDPRIVPVAPGARVSLVATPPYTVTEERGAIVIFRR